MKSYKKSLKILLLSILALTIVTVSANIYIHKKVGNELKKINHLTYNSLDINVFKGSLVLHNAQYLDENKNFASKKVEISGFSILNYLRNKKVDIANINVNALEANLKKSSKKADKKASTRPDIPNIEIKNIYIKGIELNHYDSLNNKKLATQNFTIHISDVKADKSTLQNKVPFNYSNFSANIDSLFLDMDNYHSVTIDKINIENNNFAFLKTHINPKFNKEQHQKEIPYEKDRYTVEIEEINTNNFNLNNNVFTLDLLKINNSITNIYRDKNTKDDIREKALYSKMIRETSINFNIKKIEINNGDLTYIEKTKNANTESNVHFTDLNATATNIGNTGKGASKVKANAKFFNQGNISFNWNFNYNNLNDAFTVNGKITNVEGNDINNFIYPAMSAKIQGKIKQIAYNFAGNKSEAKGDMLLDYNNLEVEFYDENGKKKQRFVSKFINVFLGSRMNNGPINKKDIEVERDKEKSFWNFLWLCIRTGAFKSLI